MNENQNIYNYNELKCAQIDNFMHAIEIKS